MRRGVRLEAVLGGIQVLASDVDRSLLQAWQVFSLSFDRFGELGPLTVEELPVAVIEEWVTRNSEMVLVLFEAPIPIVPHEPAKALVAILCDQPWNGDPILR